MIKTYKTKDEVSKKAQEILNKSLCDVISDEEIKKIEEEITEYKNRRKGLLGGLIEKYFFGIEPGNVSEPDFKEAGVELKTTPLKKHDKKKYVSKERLVFSMINYDTIVDEKWESSSFLKKNKVLLLMFYLWLKEQSILEHKFKFVQLIDLLDDISEEDIYQIQKDWEFIVAKIGRGEAHLLSEGDTYYLGACTKAANSRVVRDQPCSRVPAKPRAFSFKQQYLNFLIQKNLLGRDVSTDSIFKKERRRATIEEIVEQKFRPFLGMTDAEIKARVGWDIEGRPKQWKRLLVNRMLGVRSNKIEELEKANVTLKAIVLEHTGTLRESISFPHFDYKGLVTQVWYDDKNEEMSDFHLQLETRRFLFVIFQKVEDSEEIIFKKFKFWNFPMRDLEEAEKIWKRTIDCIEKGTYGKLPKISDSKIIHVRPHGKDSNDTIKTPQGTQEMKRCFWLNAKYIQEQLELDRI